jgi:hypothetical protein
MIRVGPAGWPYKDWKGVVYPLKPLAASANWAKSVTISMLSRLTLPSMVLRAQQLQKSGLSRSPTMQTFSSQLSYFTHSRTSGSRHPKMLTAHDANPGVGDSTCATVTCGCVGRGVRRVGMRRRGKSGVNSYFDASGNSTDQLVVAVAGFIATPQVWNDWSKEWLYRLKCDGLNLFHRTTINVKGRDLRGQANRPSSKYQESLKPHEVFSHRGE